jgi:hypothetical protein
MIILGNSNDQGLVVAYLTQDAITANEVRVTYKNIRYMEGQKVYTLNGLTKIEETLKLDLAIFI